MGLARRTGLRRLVLVKIDEAAAASSQVITVMQLINMYRHGEGDCSSQPLIVV